MQKKKAKTNVVTSPPIFYTPFLPHGVYIISFIHSCTQSFILVATVTLLIKY